MLRFGLLCLLCLLFSVMPAQAKSLEVLHLGRLTVPEALEAGPVDLQQMTVPEAKDAAPPAAAPLQPPQTSAYNLTLNDGKALHWAWLIVIRSQEPLLEGAPVLQPSLSKEQRRQFEDSYRNLQQQASREVLLSNGMAKTRVSFRAEEFLPLEYPRIAKRQAFIAGLRAWVKVDEVKLPFFAKACILASPDNRLTVAFLVSPDVDKPFWSPLFSSMLKSLTPALPGEAL